MRIRIQESGTLLGQPVFPKRLGGGNLILSWIFRELKVTGNLFSTGFAISRRAVRKTKQTPLETAQVCMAQEGHKVTLAISYCKRAIIFVCLGNADESKQHSFYIVNNTRPVKGQRLSFICTGVYIIDSSHSKRLSMAHKPHFCSHFWLFSVTST